MIRTKKRLWLCAVLIGLNVSFIWGNSLLPGTLSGALSGWIRDLIALLIPMEEGRPDAGHGLLRKLAHFTEFCTLGMCLRWLFGILRSGRVRELIYPLAAAAAVACTDELIQCFVPDRGPGLKDVGIDTLGAALGIVIISLIYYNKNKKIMEENKL